MDGERGLDHRGWWEECQALSMAFANGVDHFRDDAVLALFTEDGVLDRWGSPVTGHAALRGWLDGRPRDLVTRHVCTNFAATRSAPDDAEGFTLFTFYRGTRQDGTGPLPLTGPAMVGEYLDRFRCTADGWRIARREIRIVFQDTRGSLS